MATLPKIYLLPRDRALQIMWYMDSLYDEFGSLEYSDVADKITQKEWMITQMYFNNGYSAPLVISNLERNYIFKLH